MTDKNIDDLISELRRDEGYDESFAVVEFVRNVGSTLQSMRERHGLSRAGMAEKLGMTPGRIWQLESGALRHAPSLKTIARWARACGETVNIAASGDTVACDDTGMAPAGSHVEAKRRPPFPPVRIANVGTIGPRAVTKVETAAKLALRSEGLAHVDVVAGEQRVIGTHVELSLKLGAEDEGEPGRPVPAPLPNR